MEMQTATRSMGKVTVTITTPAGIPVPNVVLRMLPGSAEEFHACVEAAGGLADFYMPSVRENYAQAAMAGDAELRVVVEEPTREAVPDPVPAHPFFAPLIEAQKRADAAP